VWEQSFQEIEQNYQILTENDLDIKGFVTPNSQISNVDRIDILKKHHSYAFTVDNGTAAGRKATFNELNNTSPYNLFRSECTNEINAKLTIDAVKETNGLTVFYSHDIGGKGSVTAHTLKKLLDYAKSLDVKVVVPHIIAEEFTSRKGIDYIKPKDIYTDKNIYIGHLGLSNPASVDAVNIVDIDTNTITITAGENIGDLIISANSNIDRDLLSSKENTEIVFSF